MPTAVTTGLILLAAFIIAEMWRPVAVLLIVTAILGLAGVEFLARSQKRDTGPQLWPDLQHVFRRHWLRTGSEMQHCH